jgi:acyl-homoserine lactone acylase PvdQ
MLREAQVENEVIDLMLNGYNLPEDYEAPMSPIPNMDYTMLS